MKLSEIVIWVKRWDLDETLRDCSLCDKNEPYRIWAKLHHWFFPVAFSSIKFLTSSQATVALRRRAIILYFIFRGPREETNGHHFTNFMVIKGNLI